jgi:hypothetical protein
MRTHPPISGASATANSTSIYRLSQTFGWPSGPPLFPSSLIHFKIKRVNEECHTYSLTSKLNFIKIAAICIYLSSLACTSITISSHFFIAKFSIIFLFNSSSSRVETDDDS